MEFAKKKINKLLNSFLALIGIQEEKILDNINLNHDFWHISSSIISRNPYINQISFHLHSQHSGSKKLS